MYQREDFARPYKHAIGTAQNRRARRLGAPPIMALPSGDKLSLPYGDAYAVPQHLAHDFLPSHNTFETAQSIEKSRKIKDLPLTSPEKSV